MDHADTLAIRNHDIDECVDLAIASSECTGKDVVFVVAPFASPDWPSLGVHILARIAEEMGLTTSILYANLSFARLIGPEFYRSLCVTKTGDLVGERIFRQAYSRTRTVPGQEPVTWCDLNDGEPPSFTQMQDLAANWVDRLAAALAGTGPRLTGFSSTFEQTLPSLSIIERLKQQSPGTTVLLGGANTDGGMGAALQMFEPLIDHVFIGESDSSFAHFLDDFFFKKESSGKVIQGQNNERLDDLPEPDFRSFFKQFEATVLAPNCQNGLDRSELRIPYESSRGCWWGAKHHCTFCGLNANGMNHRIKSADKVADEILTISSENAVDKVIMVDNIMPYPYFSTLLPRLASTERKLSIFYEQKSNINLDKMKLLSAAGIRSIQPGIESLSTDLLRLMKKGVSARTNIDCMRYARACGVDIVWNVLVDFPGDSEAAYLEMIELMPKLHHLAPPTGISTISIDRFSPYHSDPEAYGIQNLQPIEVYDELFPGADVASLAYHFQGDYASAARSRPDLVDRLETIVKDWIKAWKQEQNPLLCVFDLDADKSLLIDTRSLATDDAVLLDEMEVNVMLRGSHELSPQTSALLDNCYLAEIDGKYSPLAFTDAASQVWNN